MAGGLRAAGPKADLALIVADADAVAAGVFTTNVMCAAPVLYCKQALAKNKPARAVSSPLRTLLKQPMQLSLSSAGPVSVGQVKCLVLKLTCHFSVSLHRHEIV